MVVIRYWHCISIPESHGKFTFKNLYSQFELIHGRNYLPFVGHLRGMYVCNDYVLTQRANVRTMYVPARTYGFGMDNIQNESFLDVRVRTYNTYRAVGTIYVRSNTRTESK